MYAELTTNEKLEIVVGKGSNMSLRNKFIKPRWTDAYMPDLNRE